MRGMLKKVAVNWLAGMPAVVKPASATSAPNLCPLRQNHPICAFTRRSHLIDMWTCKDLAIMWSNAML